MYIFYVINNKYALDSFKLVFNLLNFFNIQELLKG